MVVGCSPGTQAAAFGIITRYGGVVTGENGPFIGDKSRKTYLQVACDEDVTDDDKRELAEELRAEGFEVSE
jgi:hypothetical protein